MSKENDKKQKEKISLTRAFTSDLKGRQSVRATFRLTQGCIEGPHPHLLCSYAHIFLKCARGTLAEELKIKNNNGVSYKFQ